VRLLVASLVVALSVVVSVMPSADPPVAEAAESCWKAMPWAPLGNVIVGTGASGAYALAPDLTAKVTLGAAGGAAPAAAGVTVSGVAAAAGTVGLSAAAFLAASAGTCKFLDWVTSDGDTLALTTPLIGNMSVTAPLGWQTYSAVTGGATDSANGPAMQYNLANPLPTLTATSWRCQQNNVAFTVGGNNFPIPQYDKLYPNPNNTLAPTFGNGSNVSSACNSSSAGSLAQLNGATVVNTSFAGLTRCAGIGTNDWNLTAQPQELGPGVGGNCGNHPRLYTVLHNSGVTHALFYVNPDVAQYGWRRQIVTDALCKDINSVSESWVRATSAVYRDRQQSARIEVPTCPVGRVARIIRAQRVPINVTCTLGSICYGTDNIIHYQELPTSLTTVATKPAWIECLASGYNCEPPQLVNGVCYWNGVVVTVDACSPGQLAGTSANPITVPQATGVLDPAPYAPGEPQSTATVAPTTTPTTVPSTGTVTVPIEPGTGPRPGGVLEDGEAECWPSGWGWFNPAQWVLRPIKCAITWAVVPSSTALASRLDTVNDLRDRPPMQWVDEGASYIGGSSMLFAKWSDAGPSCTSVLDTNVCPREWDNPTAVPGFVLAALLFGLWSALVFAVWRWF
jgi:hypothetical protein